MQLDINNKVVDIFFGLDFIEYLDNKYSVSQSGVKFGMGVQRAYLTLVSRSPLILVDLIRAGQSTSDQKATIDEIKGFIESQEDVTWLYNDFLEELKQSALTKDTVAVAESNLKGTSDE